VGINVNNRALDLPPPVREGAISLRDATGRIWELGELLATVLQAIETEIKEGVCQSSR
jgi:biotin-(acetyl-CoA carboxylase) ligase